MSHKGAWLFCAFMLPNNPNGDGLILPAPIGQFFPILVCGCFDLVFRLVRWRLGHQQATRYMRKAASRSWNAAFRRMGEDGHWWPTALCVFVLMSCC